MSPSAVPLVKDVIRNIRYSQAEELAAAALTSESPAEVLDLCRDLTQKIAPEILQLV